MTLEDIGKEINIESLEKENISLKSKIEALRANNNSYLYSAFCKFQGELPIISKNETSYKNQAYASFPALRSITAPLLAKYGLSIRQDPITVDGVIAFKTKVMHSSGQFEESIFLLPSVFTKDTNRNVISSDMSFYRRHIYMSVLGIVTEKDD